LDPNAIRGLVFICLVLAYGFWRVRQERKKRSDWPVNAQRWDRIRLWVAGFILTSCGLAIVFASERFERYIDKPVLKLVVYGVFALIALLLTWMFNHLRRKRKHPEAAKGGESL